MILVPCARHANFAQLANLVQKAAQGHGRGLRPGSPRHPRGLSLVLQWCVVTACSLQVGVMSGNFEDAREPIQHEESPPRIERGQRHSDALKQEAEVVK